MRASLKCLSVSTLSLCLSGACVPASTSPVRLNEVMPANKDSCADQAGEQDDWIELFNTSNVSLDLSGYSLTDDTSLPYQSVLPAGTVIPALGTLLFWADATPAQGKDHLTLSLKSEGEEVVLYDADARQVDIYHWTSASNKESYARFPDGTGQWSTTGHPTCGTNNSSGKR